VSAPGDTASAPLLAVVGPTGVGKTAVAVALAGLLPIEVIGVDSRQVYRDLDLGTGKPSQAERRAARHHLVDVAAPDEVYDAARFVREAGAAIADVRARGRLPVLVGGTGLYFRALVRGLAPAPPADLELRRRLREEARSAGPEALHERLRGVDPEAAARLHPRDLVRVTRALEIVTVTGQPVATAGGAVWRREPERFRLVTVGLTMARETLDARLDARVEAMIAAGLLAEIEGLLARGVAPELPAMQGIGYRHLVPVLRGQVSLEAAVGEMKRDTRRYARRQWTWFGREPDVQWLAIQPGAPDKTLEAVKKLIDRTRLFHYADS
jgi:tRNA dimethylallyltransferase